MIRQNRVPGFAIVVCTYNGKSRLAETLLHILQLKIPVGIHLELVIVDNRSNDGTVGFIEGFFKENIPAFPVKILTEDQPGKPYALEKAFNDVSCSHSITCDDDNWLDPDYLIYAQDIIARYEDVGIIGARLEGVFEGEVPDFFDQIKAAYVVGEQAKEAGYFDQNTDYVWGAGMVLKMEVWDKLRESDFSFSIGKNIGKAVGEDSELSLLTKFLGYRFYYDDRLLVKHFMPAQRLTWKVATNYFKGFGSTKPYFIIYKNIYKKGSKLSVIQLEREILRLMIFIYKKHKALKKNHTGALELYSNLEYSLFESYFSEVFSLMKFRRNVYGINEFMGRLFEILKKN